MTAATFPVIEVFGPTIQGEGAEAGQPCHFVRFGGCDFRCTWCDSMYAVDPAEVRANAERLSATAILNLLNGLDGSPRWVVLSGGNPALLDLAPLVAALQEAGYLVAVETQGSRWQPWLADVDRLTVSPKPPSSGMVTGAHAAAFRMFMADVSSAGKLADTSLKIVVADERDLAWATNVIAMYPVGARFLSVCTPQYGEADPDGNPIDNDLDMLLAVTGRYRWLCERVAAEPDLRDVKVLPQLHVIAWGSRRGV